MTPTEHECLISIRLAIDTYRNTSLISGTIPNDLYWWMTAAADHLYNLTMSHHHLYFPNPRGNSRRAA